MLDDGEDAIAGILGIISSFVLVEEPYTHTIKYWNDVPGREWPTDYDFTSFRKVRHGHSSVKEYLISRQLRVSSQHISRFAFEATKSHGTLGQKSSAYFALFITRQKVQAWIDENVMPNASPIPRYLSDVPDFVYASPLLNYVCHNWAWHQRLAEHQIGPLPAHQRLHLQFLENERVWAAWLHLEDLTFGPYSYGKTYFCPLHGRDGSGALYWAAFLGLRETFSLLCTSEATPRINHVAGHYVFAVKAAPDCVHSTAGACGIAFAKAIFGNDDDCISDLLKAGTERDYIVTTKDIRELNQLVATKGLANEDISNQADKASAERTMKLARVLMQANVTVDLSTELLLAAIKYRKETLFESLLESIKAELSVLSDCLLISVRSCLKRNIKALVEAGACLNYSRLIYTTLVEVMYDSPLKGKAVFDLLLDLGLDIAGDHYLLIAAAGLGDEALVKNLVDAGANPDHESIWSLSIPQWIEGTYQRHPYSALTEAMVFGTKSSDSSGAQCSLRIIQTLLNAGVHVDRGGDALCKAIIRCSRHVERDVPFKQYSARVKLIMQLLLTHGADLTGPLDTVPSVLCSVPQLGWTLDCTIFGACLRVRCLLSLPHFVDLYARLSSMS